MGKKMLVTGSYYDKESGTPRCMVAPISEGISKKNGKPFCIVDTERREVIEADYPVGAFIDATTTYAVQSSDGASQNHGMKLNK